MELNINGTTYDLPDSPPRQLLWVIRDELGMIGTKFGCGAGICGSCTVHVDGETVRSCVTRANDVVGKDIRTIESMAEMDEEGHIIQLHPVQEAFLENQVPQCSWCMSGQMMTAIAFLEQNNAPSEEEILDAMSNNYCRCGCYFRIKQAVSDAAAKMQEVA